MSLGDLASIGSFISAVAVVVSLVYLSLQIRQNTKHSRALIQQGRAGRIADTALRLAEAPVWLDRCFEGSPDLTSQELRRFLHLCRAIFVSAEDSFFQRREGLMEEIVFQSFESSVKRGFNAIGLAAAWMLTREMYEPEFRAYMDRSLGNLDPANWKARGTDAWAGAIAELLAKDSAGLAAHP